MVEPHQKRLCLSKLLKSSYGNDGVPKEKVTFPKFQIEMIHSELKKECLCKLLLPDILRTLILCTEYFSSKDVASLTKCQNEVLLYTGMICLFFEVSARQKSKGIFCSRISEVVTAGADNEGDVLEILFCLLSIENKYISYSAGRALTSLLLMLNNKAALDALEKIADNLCESDFLLEVGHSLDIIRRIIEWKDIDEHPLDGTPQESYQPVGCSKSTLNPSDTQGSNEIKHAATKTLESKWFALVSKLLKLLTDYTTDSTYVIVSFLSLWESVISVKTNLSVVDTKEFYSGLERLLSLLVTDTHSIIWKKVLDLYNEVLCYGNTLALQDVLAEEPCSLAHLIIRAVKDRKLLDCVPCWVETTNLIIPLEANDIDEYPTSSSSTSQPISRSEDICSMVLSNNDKTILHKIVLLIFKAIAVTVKETRCDSSSENSSKSGGSGSEDVDMEIIERSLQEVRIFW